MKRTRPGVWILSLVFLGCAQNRQAQQPNISVFPSRDLYRVGIGFDLLEIKNALSKKTPDTTQKPMASTANMPADAPQIEETKPAAEEKGSTATRSVPVLPARPN